MHNILELEDISKHIQGSQIINQVSLSVIEGEIHALIGPNGAGKTTLFNLITGKFRPSDGKIFFQGKRIDHASIHKIARKGLARSFQITNIFTGMSVYENMRNAIVARYKYDLKIWRLLKGMRFIDETTQQFLNRINLADLSQEKAGTLSYGHQRALEMGITMALDPQLVLLDEPTAGMTAEETSAIVDLIRQITKNKTLVIVEHDMDVVFKLAHRISVLHHGEILATGTPKEIKQNRQVKEAYLGGFFE